MLEYDLLGPAGCWEAGMEYLDILQQFYKVKHLTTVSKLIQDWILMENKC